MGGTGWRPLVDGQVLPCATAAMADRSAWEETILATDATTVVELGVPDASAQRDDWPSPLRAWGTLILLMAGLMVSCLDRGCITLLVEPIKREYDLTDTQFGALQSIAFGAFYILMAIPIGMLADRWQRRLVIGIGGGLFSLFSLSTGLAHSYGQLFLARIGVGFGEASIGPAGYSLTSDYFPPHKLGRALSLLTMANYIGTALALTVGGWLFGQLSALARQRHDALMGLAPWQATVALLAVPGLLLTPMLFLMREPPRRGLARNRLKLSFREVLQELAMRRTCLVLMILGMAMGSLMLQAFLSWTPALLERAYGWGTARAGFGLGALMLGGSVVGSLLAGWFTDWLTIRNRLDAPIKVAMYSFAGVGLFGVVAPFAPEGEMALLLMAPILILSPMGFSASLTGLQMVVPNQLRAQVSAMHLTVINLVGLCIGPLLVAMMTDLVFTGTAGVRYSMALVSATTVLPMLLLLAAALEPFVCLRRANIVQSREADVRPARFG